MVRIVLGVLDVARVLVERVSEAIAHSEELEIELDGRGFLSVNLVVLF